MNMYVKVYLEDKHTGHLVPIEMSTWLVQKCIKEQQIKPKGGKRNARKRKST
jgi:hypothetical protein